MVLLKKETKSQQRAKKIKEFFLNLRVVKTRKPVRFDTPRYRNL